MNDNLNANQDETDGSESRFNPIRNQGSFEQPQSPPVFESWLDPQPESVNPVIPILEETKPIVIESESQAVQAPPVVEPVQHESPSRKGNTKKPGFWLIILCALLIIVFFFTPFRITTLVLGIDSRPTDGPWLGRSDTMILSTIPPISPQVSILSIPRDLWLPIPNHYENRINTAHYFAELEAPGSGMQAAKEAVAANFGIKVNYAVRIKFSGFVDIVDAFGGITVNLPKDMSGLSAGPNHLDGTQALAFVRDRQAGDDFFRQQRGQLLITAAIRETLNPLKWPRIPAVLTVAAANIDTDLPIWLWPRTAFSMAFSALKGLDAQTLGRDMIIPWVTNEGAQVLAPNWDLINPLIDEMFK